MSGYISASYDGDQGDDCLSDQIKKGRKITVKSSLGSGSATLGPGEHYSDWDRCDFPFKARVPAADVYQVDLGGEYAPADFVVDDPTDLIVNLPDSKPNFSKTEVAYLRAKGVKPDARNAKDIVQEGSDECDRISEADTTEGRIDSVLNDDVDRKAIQYLCPKYQRFIKMAEGAFSDGNYSIPEDIEPGTYRTFGPTSDCYWERATRNGEILANDFVSNAPDGIVVTIRSSDGAFKSEGCDLWIRR